VNRKPSAVHAVALVLIPLLLVSCSKPPLAGPVSTKRIQIRKLVVFANDTGLEGHFSLENEQEQQIALSGKLTLSCFLESKVNVQDQPAFNMKSEIYRGSKEVGVGDFQWIYYHSFLTEDDFVCRFRIPLQKFRSKPPGGRYMGFKFEFKPDVYPSALELERQVWMPGK
jgi:hypothetical protein